MIDEMAIPHIVRRCNKKKEKKIENRSTYRFAVQVSVCF